MTDIEFPKLTKEQVDALLELIDKQVESNKKKEEERKRQQSCCHFWVIPFGASKSSCSICGATTSFGES